MNAEPPADPPPIDPQFVIGTAGHVDHGKSTLVKALTGTDPDRLAEERARAMTIDLGFAALTLPDGKVVSIIDVPGHERFVRNMLAGVGGIDLAMLVVAADDGPMPQTHEHLAILDLLGVERGMVVVTRADLVDDEWRDLVIEECHDLLEGTTLAGAPVVTVSALTGDGLDVLRQTLQGELARASARDASGVARLPVDRAFHVAGFGTVATGTLLGGTLHPGDELMLYPDRQGVRVRGMQAHGAQVQVATAGTRVALNLGGVDRADVERGKVLATPGSLTPSLRFDARVRLLASSPVPLRQNDEVVVFIGSAEVPVHVTLLDRDAVLPGEVGWMQLRLSQMATALRGDRFVLRRPSPAVTIGGGVVVDPVAARHRRLRPEVIATLEVLEQGTPEELVLRALGDGALEVGNLASAAGLVDAESVIAQMIERGEVIALSTGAPGPRTVVMPAAVFDRARARAIAFLTDYHHDHPLRPGARREAFGDAIGVRAQRALDEVITALAERDAIRVEGPIVALPDFAIVLSGAARERADAFLAAARQSPYSPPAIEGFGIDEGEVAALAATGEVVRVADQIAYPIDVFDDIVAGVTGWLDREGAITLAQYRDLFGTSRKYAQPTLEHLDDLGFTRRKGDTRVRSRGAGASR